MEVKVLPDELKSVLLGRSEVSVLAAKSTQVQIILEVCIRVAGFLSVEPGC